MKSNRHALKKFLACLLINSIKSCGRDDREIVVRIPEGSTDSSLLHGIHTGSAARQVPYSMDSMTFFHWGNAKADH